ncbi:MAG: tyrosine-type recombinase/integrase [Gammaproteobacteria bacterium]
MVTDDPNNFGAFARVYLDWHRHEYPDSNWRVVHIINTIFAHLHPRALDAVTPLELERWKMRRLGEVSKSTVLKELRSLAALYNAAVTWGVTSHNPVRAVRKPREHQRPPRWYSADELSRIYRVAGAHAPWWRLVANTGLRLSEALQLRHEDIRAGVLHVVSRAGARTKSLQSRQVPLSPGAVAALAQLPESGNQFVLPRMHPKSMSRAFRRDAHRAGLNGSLHTLRHTFAAHLASSGIPLREIQLLLGHSTIRVTEIYAHLAPERLTAAVARLDL